MLKKKMLFLLSTFVLSSSVLVGCSSPQAKKTISPAAPQTDKIVQKTSPSVQIPDSEEYVDTSTNIIWRRCPIGSDFAAGKCIGGASQNQITLVSRIRDSEFFDKGWRLPSSSEVVNLITKLSGIGYRSGDYAYGRTECEQIKQSVLRVFPKNSWIQSSWDSNGTIPYYSLAALRDEGKIRTHPLYTQLSYYGQCGISDSGGFYQHVKPNYVHPIIVVKSVEVPAEWTGFVALIKGSQTNIASASVKAKDKDLDYAVNNTALGKVAQIVVDAKKTDGVSSSSPASEGPSASSRSSASGSQYRCEFNCTKLNLTGAANRVNGNSVKIGAKSESAARAEAAKYAKSYCWDNHKMVLTEEWGSGTVRCSKN